MRKADCHNFLISSQLFSFPQDFKSHCQTFSIQLAGELHRENLFLKQNYLVTLELIFFSSLYAYRTSILGLGL